MKKIILFLFAISLFHSLTISQWVQQTSGVTTPLLDIDFINENTGWACGDGGVILKTTNGGVNWLQQPSGVLKRLEGIDAIDENNLFCVGWFQTILRSTNSGQSWIIIRDGPSGTGSTFFKTYFINPNTGWLLRSGGGYVLRTTNAGLTFDSVFTNNSFNRDVFFKDANTGVICGDGAWIIRSTDGGVTWNQIIIPWGTELPNFYRFSFVGNLGWTIGNSTNLPGAGPKVFHTTDFGITWDTIGRVPYPNNEENYSVFFSSINTGYAGGTNGYLYKSTNGGLNWHQQMISGGGFRRDFYFTNDSLGWVVGGGGQIFKTTTGGQFVSIEPISGIIPKEFNLNQNYPNPFNGQTVISFDISEIEIYKIEIFDILGRKVEEIFKKKLTQGSYNINYSPGNLPSGVYIYRLSSIKNSQSKKFILIK
jgi:photosystem II stability/assembly factor-like uncharacterized protein